MKNQQQTQVQRRRTFGIISHPDAGKTTLTEKLLLFGGAIKSRKADRHATSDWMAIEQEARLRAEYNVDAIYEGVDYATARWVRCSDPKRLAGFEKANQANLAHDAEGNLTYLASSEWRLGFVAEQWPEISFLKTREHDQEIHSC